MEKELRLWVGIRWDVPNCHTVFVEVNLRGVGRIYGLDVRLIGLCNFKSFTSTLSAHVNELVLLAFGGRGRMRGVGNLCVWMAGY